MRMSNRRNSFIFRAKFIIQKHTAMKRFAGFLLPALLLALASCNSNNTTSTTNDSTTAGTQQSDTTASSGSTANFKLGVQMWTFNKFSFTDALNKVDSAGIKNIE